MKTKTLPICLLLILSLVSSYTLLLCFFDTFNIYVARAFLRDFFLSGCYIVLIALLWKSKLTRLLSLILSFLWIINISISVVLYHLFEIPLNNQLAMTVLSTNIGEIKNFLVSHWYLVLIIALFYVALCVCVTKLSSQLPMKWLVTASAILLLTFSYKFVESVCRGKLNEPNFSMLEKILPYSSLENYSIFVRAYEDMKILTLASQHKPEYLLNVEDTNISTYVLVIGESVRRDHVSLYGYSRKTTPQIDENKSNLLIFEQAVAAAPITTMALASALTVKPVESKNFTLLGDNIINLANAAGYKTYWYSKQDTLGQYSTVVTSIAQNASVIEWVKGEYDDSLLPKLREALEDSSTTKKLIILHTNGSHFDACAQYPESESFFSGGASRNEDCYDDTILFMDKLMGNIYSELAGRAASVLYFSDHGQVRRIKRGKLDYFHGSINPSKESVEVPQFIWFSPVLASKTVGNYSPIYSTSENYSLIANWLGITHINRAEIKSPLIEGYKANEAPIIMDTRAHIFKYPEMRSDIMIY